MQLEEELGVKLFKSNNHSIYLTDERKLSSNGLKKLLI